MLGPYIPYGLFQAKGEMCAKFGSDWFRNVNLYNVQTNKQTKTFSFIYKIGSLKSNVEIHVLELICFKVVGCGCLRMDC